MCATGNTRKRKVSRAEKLKAVETLLLNMHKAAAIMQEVTVLEIPAATHALDEFDMAIFEVGQIYRCLSRAA